MGFRSLPELANASRPLLTGWLSLRLSPHQYPEGWQKHSDVFLRCLLFLVGDTLYLKAVRARSRRHFNIDTKLCKDHCVVVAPDKIVKVVYQS